uniref:PX domain-containing protein n=1 Tax=Rhodnius prolixus TaxID=13249 RepID=T1HXK4_RHOPR
MSTFDFQDYNVNVDNPQKHLDPMDTYISFRITTKVKQKMNEDMQYIVRRRYNDFLWLRSRLIETFPTLVVPALPAKHNVLEQLDRYSRSFIMARMAMLHTYLQRLTSHPVFSCSPLLKLFLTAKSAEFMMHSKNSAGLLDRITGSLQTLTGYRNTLLCPEFENVRQYTNHLSAKLIVIHDVAAKIQKERIELAYDIEEGKRAVENWLCLEPDLSYCLHGIRDALVSVLGSQKHLLQIYSTNIEQPLEEYLSYTDAVKEALNRRDAIQYNYESSRDETARKRIEKEQLEILDNTNGFGFKLWKATNRDKIKKLQQDLPILESMVEDNHDKLEIANEGMRADLERWHLERKSEIKEILTRIAHYHVLYYQEAWEKALEAVKNVNKDS